jgi:ABC-type lipoprotein release transport system permease subunit
MVYATLMGLLGGLLPAWKAARMPVVTALRQL